MRESKWNSTDKSPGSLKRCTTYDCHNKVIQLHGMRTKLSTPMTMEPCLLSSATEAEVGNVDGTSGAQQSFRIPSFGSEI